MSSALAGTQSSSFVGTTPGKVQAAGSEISTSSTGNKQPAYKFHNGNTKQPVLRARESSCHVGNIRDTTVGLSFNYWADHNYITDHQLGQVILTCFSENANEYEDMLREGSLARIDNIVLVSLQEADPRELNDSISTLPFLDKLTCMPIRHVRENHAPMLLGDAAITGQSSCDHTWQYLPTEPSNSMLLWTDRPSVPLSEVAGVNLATLLASYVVFFEGVHTNWRDDVVLYAEAPCTSATKMQDTNPTSSGTSTSTSTAISETVQAFQDLARQKLLYGKEQAALMMQLFGELTKPSLPGDVYGRCQKSTMKESGMFLYRPSPDPTKRGSRLTLIWQRTRDIEVLEEQTNLVRARTTCTPTTTPSQLTFVKLSTAQLLGGSKSGTSRFVEQTDLTLTLCGAVEKDATASATVIAPEPMPVLVDVITGVVDEVTTVPSDINTEDHASVGALIAEGKQAPAGYFTPALQQQLRAQHRDPAVRAALERFVLSPSMQELMGFVTSRSDGYEDFLCTHDVGFFRPAQVPDAVAATRTRAAAPPRAVSSVPAVGTGVRGRSAAPLAEMEEGEEPESPEAAQSSPVPSPQQASPSVAAIVPGNGVNKKIYFDLDTGGNVQAEASSGGVVDSVTGKDDEDASGSDGSGGSSSSDVDALVQSIQNSQRQRKRQRADMAHSDSDSDDQAVGPEEAPSSVKRSRPDDSVTLPAAVPPPPPPPRGRPLPPLPPIPSYSLGAVRPPQPPPRPAQQPPQPQQPPQSPAALATAAPTATSEVFAQPAQAAPAPPAVTYTPTLIPPHSISTPLAVCALDCEMCTTPAGLELTRLTLLCPENGVVYDTLVKPELEVTNYHTEFSGITKEALLHVSVTLEDVQATLRQFIDASTIIVGHSADNDLKVLQLVHRRVIDTSALFVHPGGLPYKHALRRLAREHLHKDIQDGNDGHDSVQDAAVALELAFLKASKLRDNAPLPPWADEPVPKSSLFQRIIESGKTKTAKKMVNISVHGLESHMSEWERAAFGYRPESDCCVAVKHCRESVPSFRAGEDQGEAQRGLFQAVRHHNSDESFQHALDELHEARRQPGCERRFMMVELRCDDSSGAAVETHSHSDTAGEVDPSREGSSEHYDEDLGEWVRDDDAVIDDSGSKELTGLVRVDDQVRQMYEAAPPRTMVVVVTQGSLVALRMLASQKLRYRWEQATIKRKQSLVGQGRVAWDPIVDEGRLCAAAAHATAGAVFLVKKP